MTSSAWMFASALVLTVAHADAGSQSVAAALRPAVPADAVKGILDAFDSHAIVALPDAHGNEQTHEFLLTLIRHPRFAATVNDIVVEFGNARYQDVVDRFVRGQETPFASLRLAWRNTTQPSIAADYAMHEEFFRAVRAVNASAPRDRQMRVLLGDPPIDWDTIRTKEEHFKWIEMRDAYPTALLQLEVLAKGRRALLVYGIGHLQRRNVVANFEMEDWRAQTIISLIERSGPARVFTIWGGDPAKFQAGATPWPASSLAPIRGTALGAVDAAQYFGWGSRFAVGGGALVPIPKEQWRTLRAEVQFDALLYLGDAPAMPTRLPAGLCSEPGYVDMRLKRIALAGLPPPEVDRVKAHCAAAK